MWTGGLRKNLSALIHDTGAPHHDAIGDLGVSGMGVQFPDVHLKVWFLWASSLLRLKNKGLWVEAGGHV